MKNSGKVYLVGAGCGDYDLITLRGKTLLSQCDVVVYDSLIDIRLLNFVPENSEKICVGKRAGQHSETQKNINNILVQKALEGGTVVRLKGGDPFVFGRGGEEILALQEHNIEYAVVPGISSSIAVPELAGIPVTHRRLSRSFHVITGHTAEDMLPENMSTYAKLEGTLVFLMGLKNLRQIATGLIENGKSPTVPTAVISSGASSNQQIVRATLENIADEVQSQDLKSPAIIVVGEVAKFDFMQTISLPLHKVSVAVTGTKRFASKLSAQLEKLGAEVKMLDYMSVIEYTDNSTFDKALLNLNDYSWIVLTSINGAEIFIKRLKKLKIDFRNLSKIKFAVIGSGTARVLENYGIFADLIPDDYTSKALGNSLSKLVCKDERVLLLRAEQGSK
jgi:uroporphyrinogen III methyltransferase/synthase